MHPHGRSKVFGAHSLISAVGSFTNQFQEIVPTRSSQRSREQSRSPPFAPRLQSKTHVNFPEHLSSALRFALFHVMMKIYLGCVGGRGWWGVGVAEGLKERNSHQIFKSNCKAALLPALVCMQRKSRSLTHPSDSCLIDCFSSSVSFRLFPFSPLSLARLAAVIVWGGGGVVSERAAALSVARQG